VDDFTLNQGADNAPDTNKIVEYWIEMAENDFNTMEDFYSIKRYNWSLFIGHLVLEKFIKALYVKINKKHPPFLHDLTKLLSKCNVEVTEELYDLLDVITTFNINARYDDYKKAFYNQCTPQFTETWINHIKTIRLWIINTHLK